MHANTSLPRHTQTAADTCRVVAAWPSRFLLFALRSLLNPRQLVHTGTTTGLRTEHPAMPKLRSMTTAEGAAWAEASDTMHVMKAFVFDCRVW